MTEQTPAVEARADGDDRRRRGIAATTALAAVLLLYAGVIGAARASMPDLSTAAMPVAAADTPPLDLSTVGHEVAEHYRFAAEHERHYAAVPCYCGCETFLSHRNLYDCFVRADGAGWDSHGAGCAICQAESKQARRLIERGDDPDAVRAAIIDRFGPSEPRTTTS